MFHLRTEDNPVPRGWSRKPTSLADANEMLTVIAPEVLGHVAASLHSSPVAYPELVSKGVSKTRKFKWLVKVGASIYQTPDLKKNLGWGGFRATKNPWIRHCSPFYSIMADENHPIVSRLWYAPDGWTIVWMLMRNWSDCNKSTEQISVLPRFEKGHGAAWGKRALLFAKLHFKGTFARVIIFWGHIAQIVGNTSYVWNVT